MLGGPLCWEGPCAGRAPVLGGPLCWEGLCAGRALVLGVRAPELGWLLLLVDPCAAKGTSSPGSLLLHQLVDCHYMCMLCTLRR